MFRFSKALKIVKWHCLVKEFKNGAMIMYLENGGARAHFTDKNIWGLGVHHLPVLFLPQSHNPRQIFVSSIAHR